MARAKGAGSSRNSSEAPAGAMRALSIRQPWAELILRGIKDVENRSRVTSHRGPLLVHAGRQFDPMDLDDFGLTDPTVGAIVGVVDIVDCTPEVSSVWHEQGQLGWYLANPRRFPEPIPYKGAVGIMNVPRALVDAALERATPPTVSERDFTPVYVEDAAVLKQVRAGKITAHLRASPGALMMQPGQKIDLAFDDDALTTLRATVARVQTFDLGSMFDRVDGGTEKLEGSPEELEEAVLSMLYEAANRERGFSDACRAAGLDPALILTDLYTSDVDKLTAIHYKLEPGQRR